MAASNYTDWLPKLTPPWLLGSKGGALINALASEVDELLQRCKDGVKERFSGYASRDALNAIAFERILPRGASETDAQWAIRLRQAFDIWYWAGSPYGILRALYTAGYAPQLIIGQGQEYELDTSTGLVLSQNSWGGPFDFTGRGTSFWSAFVIYFPTARWPASWTAAGNPPLESSVEAQTLMRLVHRWRPAYATFARVVMQGTGPIWGIPPGTAAGQWGTTRVWNTGTYWSWDPTTLT
jgi:hypothetical protein